MFSVFYDHYVIQAHFTTVYMPGNVSFPGT